jgi:hypothetical protein
MKNIYKIFVSAEGKVPEEVIYELQSKIKLKEFNNTIVLIRVEGELASGRPSDIDFKSLVKELYNKSAYFVMRSTSQLTSKEFLESDRSSSSPEDVEADLIRKHISERPRLIGDASLIKQLMQSWCDDQKDGEKKYEYESRMKREADRLLG